MIGNVTTGNGFAGLLAYLLRDKQGELHERVEWTATRNLFSDDPNLIAVLMRSTAEQNQRAEKPVYHLSISLDKGEALGREQFEQVVDRTLDDLGLSDHQALIVSHNDTDYEHVHVMVNRVHPETGRVWRNGHDFARIEKSLRQQEQELGLRPVRGRHFALEGQERFRGAAHTLSKGARRVAERTGRPSFTELTRVVARPVLRQARSWVELHRKLDDLGLGLAKRGRGLVLTNDQQTTKLSLVDRQSSLARLEKQLGPWQPPTSDQRPSPERWRDVALLRRLGERLSRDKAAEEQRQRVERTVSFEHRRAIEEADRTRRQLSSQLDRRLARIYRDPATARHRLMDRSWDEGALRSRFVPKPEVFGQLRGRGGLLTSADRWEALDAVPEAAETLLQLGKLRAPTRSAAKPQPKPALARPRPSRLDRLARRLVHRLGWKLATSILPPSHLTALRLALSVSRKALDLMLEPDRGRGR